MSLKAAFSYVSLRYFSYDPYDLNCQKVHATPANFLVIDAALK